MAYNTSTGSRDFDDMRYQQDRDTQIDWDQDSISFKTNDVTRVVIDNSAISASGDATFVGATVVGSTFNVSGATTLAGDTTFTNLSGSGTLQVVGNTFLGGDLEVSGTTAYTGGTTFTNISGSGTLQAVGNTFLGGTLNVTGATTLAANTTFTNISGSGTIQSVDHVYMGNDLFISGNIDIAGGFALGSDAEGDMYYRNSAGALTRLAKGSDNHVLTMNVNVPNWEAAAAGGISFNGSTANGLVTYGNASTADVESDILFNAGNLTMDASISGSGNLQMVGNTFIGGDLKASGSLRAKQIHITQHGFNSTSTNYQYVPFYSENEQGSPNYRSSMLAPFKGRLLRVLWRCQQDINPSEVTVGVFTGSMGTPGPNTVVVEHVVMAPIAGTYQVTTFNFTGSQHFIAGDTITIGVQSDANPGTQNATGIWEFDMSEI
jgi:hypothetical protein